MKQLVFILGIFIFLSCVDDNSENITGIDDLEGYVSVTVKLPGIQTPQTYALSEESENKIETIDVFAFEQIGNEEKFCYHVESGVITDVEEGVNGNKKKFRVKLKRSSNPTRLVILANIREYLPEVNLAEGMTKESIYSQLVYNSENVWRTSSPFTPFPMWGESSLVTISTFSNPIENISLVRAVAKIDIGVDIDKDPALGFGNLFKLKDIYVCNTNKKGYIVPNLTGFSGNKVSNPNVNDQWTKNDPLEYNFQWNSSEKVQKYFQEIYVSESKEKESFIIVAAYYNGSSQLSYYRLDFVENNNAELSSYLPVLRNHRYLLNITGLKGEGYLSFEEAYDAKASNLIYGLQVTEEIINDIIYNGQYLLGVNSSTLTIDDFRPQFRKGEISVYTTYEGGWKAIVPEAYSSWLSLVAGEGESNSIESLIIKTEQLTDDFERTGTIKITSGALSKEITVRQRIGSNSYFVIAGNGEGVSIPVAMANAGDYIRVRDNTDYSIRILWQDVPGNVLSQPIIGNYENDNSRKYDYFNVKAAATGNFLVGIIDNNTSELLWSWHIWSIDNITSITTIDQGDYSFMDRNLGASSLSGTDNYGLLYQWGRKDPFPGANEETENGKYKGKTIYEYNSNIESAILYKKVTEIENLDNAIKNPTTFYTNDTSPYYDWYGVYKSNNMLWSRNNRKTPYDPCPSGWYIPSSGAGNKSPWYGLTTSNGGSWNNGWTWNGSFYPASGGRDGYTGAFIDVGVRGYLWSTTPLSFGGYMFIYAQSQSGINSSGTGNRASAYPVRCVKE